MSDSEDRWDDYGRLQQKLLKKTHVDDGAFGLEAALDRALQSVAAADELDRTARSAARRYRNRAHLVLVYGDREATCPAAGESQLDASRSLQEIEQRLSSKDWQLLCAVAHGYEYSELVEAFGQNPGALRVRTLRARRSVSDLRVGAA